MRMQAWNQDCRIFYKHTQMHHSFSLKKLVRIALFVLCLHQGAYPIMHANRLKAESSVAIKFIWSFQQKTLEPSFIQRYPFGV
jgi:hypothetical protein